jgi:15-cis-phytoene synthase
MTPVERSYEHCRRVARSEARNFYYSFLLLSKPQRDAMCAIYTFMRYCDDLSDGASTASAETMWQWRKELDAALRGEYGANLCWPAFHDAVRRYNIPHRYFHEMIDGVSSDLQPRDIQTFDELYRYCYQVASVVGLTIIHIFGYESPTALVLAEKCGIAFQLTNIIRDVKEDQEKGRIYIPKEDRDRYSDMKKLLAFQAGRARRFYDESRPLLDLVHPRSRRSLWALIEIYSTLLDRIVQSGYDVMSRRIRLSGVEKAGIVLRAMLR